MAVTVSNTSASLSGKTLLKAEDAQTITGQKTYQLGASAPFIVQAGSAKVDNLDADFLDGEDGADFHDAGQLTGAYAALSGAAITTINASNISSGTLADARLNPIVPPTVVALADGATPALDAALGNVFTLTALGDRTIAVPTNPTNGQKIIIRHLASGGARTLALNSAAGGFRFGTDVTALSQTVSGKTDYIGCVYNSTDSKWDVVAYAKGY